MRSCGTAAHIKAVKATIKIPAMIDSITPPIVNPFEKIEPANFSDSVGVRPLMAHPKLLIPRIAKTTENIMFVISSIPFVAIIVPVGIMNIVAKVAASPKFSFSRLTNMIALRTILITRLRSNVNPPNHQSANGLYTNPETAPKAQPKIEPEIA